ncbi:MAG: signal peptidase II [Clostridiales bacterium]|nr:signal peptidase II [Clostridiales bacterium]
MLELLIIAAILIIDLVSKHITAAWLPTLPGGNFPLINGVFELSYVENRGAAFGMLQDARWFFIVLTLVAVGILGWFIVKYRGCMHVRARIALALILSGAVGNFVDRLFLGYVRDMFYFSLINFAVFNVADAAITVGGIGIVIDSVFTPKGRKFLRMIDDILEKKSEAKKTEAHCEENDMKNETETPSCEEEQ